MGFAPGVREDYTYHVAAYLNVDLPVVILDNEFRNPDVDRYLVRFETHDPSVAILGDAYTPLQARVAINMGQQADMTKGVGLGPGDGNDPSSPKNDLPNTLLIIRARMIQDFQRS